MQIQRTDSVLSHSM